MKGSEVSRGKLRERPLRGGGPSSLALAWPTLLDKVLNLLNTTPGSGLDIYLFFGARADTQMVR